MNNSTKDIHLSILNGNKPVSLIAEPIQGSFALDKVPAVFVLCRERFAKSFVEELEGFYFCHKSDIHNIAAFIQKTELILNQSHHSAFCYTNAEGVLWIKPSLFWRTCEMRRSLLTILLRAAMLYDRSVNNYEEALFSHELIVPTKRAIKRFLYGFTEYRGPSLGTAEAVQVKGWKAIFEAKDELEIKRLLVSQGSGGHFRADLSLRNLCF
jgi:hypothetical protein